MNFEDIIKQVEVSPYSAFFYTPSIYKKAFSYLFLNPAEIIPVYKKEDLDYSFKFIQKLIDKKYSGYSLINYEAGFLFEEKLEKLLPNSDEKLIQFFFFDKKEIIKLRSSKIIFTESVNGVYSVSDFRLNRSEAQFIDDVKKIKKYIKEGDTYQVNYTIKGKFNFSGSFPAFFQKLLFNQSAKYSAFINNGEKFIISLSPELFFHQKGRKIISQPMKGTIHRGFNPNTDSLAETELKMSEKNRAENVMIVDLIRNDLGKICRYGSIKVPELFNIEKYESLFQMVSTVRGKLRKNINIKDIVTSIFPCGSVTGAPKIRTLEIINEVEKDERGIYTGSIGLITPKDLKMNVAIRTITVNKKSGEGVLGLGSGIVWDSDPQKEFEEVRLKSKFLIEPLDYFEIFETMKYENGTVRFLTEHLNRMRIAADYFLFKFNFKKIFRRIENEIAGLDQNQIKKIKLTLMKWGELKIEISDFSKFDEEISVVISPNKIFSTDHFRHFKTSNRKLYDDEYARYNSEGFYEVIYLNEKAELAEGSRSNIFLRKGEQWYTPLLNSGALGGIYRKYFLERNSNVFEINVKIENLLDADELLLTNALQGEVKVNKLYMNNNEFIEFHNQDSTNNQKAFELKI